MMTLVFLMYCGIVCAQEKAMYVIFTSGGDPFDGAYVYNNSDGTRQASSRQTKAYFSFVNPGVYAYVFDCIDNGQGAEQQPVVKPLSFLENLDEDECIDWDVLMPKVNTKADAEFHINRFVSGEVLYFIDRRQFNEEKCYLVPVKLRIFKKAPEKD